MLVAPPTEDFTAPPKPKVKSLNLPVRQPTYSNSNPSCASAKSEETITTTSAPLPPNPTAMADWRALSSCIQGLSSHMDSLEALLDTKTTTLSNRADVYTSLVHHLDDSQDLLDVSLTHWCTLLRAIPRMDATSQHAVKSIALHAIDYLLDHKQRTPASSSQQSQPPPSYAKPSVKTTQSCVDLHHVNIDDPGRRKADGWVPSSHLVSTPGLLTPSSSSAAIRSAPPLPTHVTLPGNPPSDLPPQKQAKFKRWLKQYNKVAPDVSAVSNWLKDRRSLHHD